MNQHRLLTISSLVAMVLTIVHLADDVILGLDKTPVSNPYVMLIFAVWLCGTLLWRERLAGRIIILLGAVMSVLMPVIHLQGRGFGDDFVKSGAGTRFISILYLLGAIGVMNGILSVQELVRGRAERREA